MIITDFSYQSDRLVLLLFILIMLTQLGLDSFSTNIPYLTPQLLMLIALWETVWKGFALWRAGRNNQLYWFLAILLLNTIGILPILYLLFFSRTEAKKIMI